MRILRFILLASSKYVTHIINYSQYTIYYILITYSFYSWKFVSLIPISHITHLPPLPLATTNMFSVSMSLDVYTYIHTYVCMYACVHTYIHTCTHTYIHTHIYIYIYIYDVWGYFWIPYINGNIQYLCFWLISLSIVSLMSIPITTNGKISLILCDWIIFYCICITSSLNPFIHWWMLKLFPDLGYCK